MKGREDAASDRDWAHVARQGRSALELLGWPLPGDCLPDEASPCGGTFAEHAVAHLVTLCAVAHHQLSHAHAPEEVISTIYAEQARLLREDCMDPGSRQ